MKRYIIALVAAVLLILTPMCRAAARAETKASDKPVHVADEQVVTVREQDGPARTGPHAECLGTFELTAYCACSECCGKSIWDPAYGVTASGTTVQEGRTIAVDPTVIPLGSVIYIQNGTACARYVAEDTGGMIKGNRIDIYFDSHEDAVEFGVQEAEVWIFK